MSRDKVLDLCKEIGIVMNLEKLSLIPAQEFTYLGIDSVTSNAFPTQERVQKLLCQPEDFCI